MIDRETTCPCSSGKEYGSCCKPFHEGKIPENALELMRSRYSAYALNLSDYIIKTTHRANPQYVDNIGEWKRSLSQFSQGTSFIKLDVLDFKEKETVATVVFTATLKQGDQDVTFSEKSYFDKVHGRWLYREGKTIEGHAPNLVTVGQLKLLPLAYYGEEILRKKAEPVGEITKEVKILVEEMIETMDASDGIGLAAPQVHHSIRLFVIREPVETKEGRVELGPVKVFINPKLSQPSKESWTTEEGCLSIPGVRAQVERPKEITVEYTTLEGETLKNSFSGLEARVIMHENDHINGIFFTDRLAKKAKAAMDPVLKRLEKRIHDNLSL